MDRFGDACIDRVSRSGELLPSVSFRIPQSPARAEAQGDGRCFRDDRANGKGVGKIQRASGETWSKNMRTRRKGARRVCNFFCCSQRSGLKRSFMAKGEAHGENAAEARPPSAQKRAHVVRREESGCRNQRGGRDAVHSCVCSAVSP